MNCQQALERQTNNELPMPAWQQTVVFLYCLPPLLFPLGVVCTSLAARITPASFPKFYLKSGQQTTIRIKRLGNLDGVMILIDPVLRVSLTCSYIFKATSYSINVTNKTLSNDSCADSILLDSIRNNLQFGQVTLPTILAVVGLNGAESNCK